MAMTKTKPGPNWKRMRRFARSSVRRIKPAKRLKASWRSMRSRNSATTRWMISSAPAKTNPRKRDGAKNKSQLDATADADAPRERYGDPSRDPPGDAGGARRDRWCAFAFADSGVCGRGGLHGRRFKHGRGDRFGGKQRQSRRHRRSVACAHTRAVLWTLADQHRQQGEPAVCVRESFRSANQCQRGLLDLFLDRRVWHDARLDDLH